MEKREGERSCVRVRVCVRVCVVWVEVMNCMCVG